MEGEKQILGKRVSPNIPHLMCVLVLATEYGQDRFFILEWEELRDIIVSDYSDWLAAKGGIRPKKPDSLHCAATPTLLEKYKNRWKSITDKAQVTCPE